MIPDLCKTLKHLGEKKAAITLLDALGRHASSLQEADLLAQSYFEAKHYLKSVEWAEKALKLSKTPEQIYSARHNLGNAYAHAFYPEKALDQLLKLDQTDKEVRLKLAYVYFLLLRRDEAEKILREELMNPANDAKTINEINFNLGTYELLKDNFHEGLYRFLHHGRQMSLWQKPQLPFNYWDGNYKEGDIVVIRSEAGIGDEFINIRFWNKFKAMGLKPLWFTERKDLKAMYIRMGYTAVSSIEEVKEHWSGQNIHWCHSMDIPVLLKITYDDLWNGPYITASDIPSNIRPSDKIKIGIRWQGNPDYDNDLHRSLPLDELMDVVSKYDADLYSLQRDDGQEDILKYPQVVPLYQTSLDTYEQTLAEIRDLDLVITSCTSIAHAAAALGKPTIILSPVSSYYVWCHKGDKSPWYGDNVTLIRQKKARDWSEPFAQLKIKLDEVYNNYSQANT